VTHALAVGVDGCRIGWIAAFAFGRGNRVTRTGLCLFEAAADIVRWRDRQADPPVVAIDVPIGLPDRIGDRPCDRAARRLLGRRQSCVFQAPDRALLDLAQKTYEAVRLRIDERRGEAPDARGLTRQGFGILPKIAEVDSVIRGEARREEWLVEVHPEVSFRALGHRDLPPKRSRAGRDARRKRLADHFPDLDDHLETTAWRRRDVGVDDRLDAYVALWSALRFRRGPEHHLVLGEGERDRKGLLMRIIV
jgi:predicted RNase H-like nuclease